MKGHWSALLLCACLGCSSELSLDRVGASPTPMADVGIDGIVLPVGTAVAVRVGEDGSPLDADVAVRFSGGRGDIAGVRPTIARHTFLIYGIREGEVELELVVAGETHRVPVRVRAR